MGMGKSRSFSECTRKQARAGTALVVTTFTPMSTLARTQREVFTASQNSHKKSHKRNQTNASPVNRPLNKSTSDTEHNTLLPHEFWHAGHVDCIHVACRPHHCQSALGSIARSTRAGSSRQRDRVEFALHSGRRGAGAGQYTA